jgi:hypothetical protein
MAQRSRNLRSRFVGNWLVLSIHPRSVLLLLAASLTIDRVVAAELERPTIIAKDAEFGFAYPSIARLANDRLLCVFSKTSSDKKTGENRAVIVATFSEDHGRTWTSPKTILESAPQLDYDPNITVIGDAVVVASTTVPATHGKFISTSRTLAVRSEDNGRTWSTPQELQTGYRYVAGKINNGILLADGTAMFPFTWDVVLQKLDQVPGEPQMDSRVTFMTTKDGGETWFRHGDVKFDRGESADAAKAINGLDEPAVVRDGENAVYMLCRTAADRLYELRSTDGGATWNSAKPSQLVSYHAPASLCEISGAKPGWLVVYDNSPKNRWPLCAAVSFDRGATWSPPRELAKEEAFQSSYPGCIQAADGNLVVVWQQDRADSPRTLSCARFDVDWLIAEDLDR